MASSRIAIRLDLLKFKNSVVANIQGNTGKKKCLIIPIEDNHLFVGQKGIYADFNGFQLKTPGENRTHLIKQSLPKDLHDNMTDEEKNAQPIFGDLDTEAGNRTPVSSPITDNAPDIPMPEADMPLPF